MSAHNALSKAIDALKDTYGRLTWTEDKSDNTSAERARTISEQYDALNAELNRIQRQGITFCKVGVDFNLKPVQQLRDFREDVGLDVYIQFSSTGECTGLCTLVYQKEANRPHRAGVAAMSMAITQAFKPALKDETYQGQPDPVGIHDDGGTPIDWMCDGEKWGEKTPDSALYPVPIEAGEGAAVIGENSFRHETVQQLLLETQFSLELTKAKVTWALNTMTSLDNRELWKEPHLNLVMMSYHEQSGKLILHGPLSFGAGTSCCRKGLSKYKLRMRGGLLLTGEKYRHEADQWFEIDLYTILQAIMVHLCLGKGELSRSRVTDGGWTAGQYSEILDYAAKFGFTRQADLSDEELETCWMLMESD